MSALAFSGDFTSGLASVPLFSLSVSVSGCFDLSGSTAAVPVILAAGEIWPDLASAVGSVGVRGVEINH